MTDPAPILKSLSDARAIVLANATIYPQVVPNVLPVINAQNHLALRRWGADFLAETFASPVLEAGEKEKLSLVVLDTLKGWLNRREVVGGDGEEDAAVIKSAVQCAASIYPLVFRHTITHPSDSAEVWSKMAAVKSTILRSMDSWSPGVRICCIKFIARVVQVQTPGLISDPRRPEQNEISLALVPRDHQIIPPNQLEAEASGLLDRLLGVLQDQSSDPLVVTATLNSLSVLVQRRASVSTKILLTVLNFNPLRLAGSTGGRLTGQDKVALKSMTRTTMSFLLNVLKRNQSHPMAGRLQQRTEQLRHSLIEAFAETGLGKRPTPDEPVDGLDNHKRMRIEQETANGTMPQQQPPPQPMQQHMPWPPPREVSYAEVFRLSQDPSAVGFHVEAIPYNIVSQLILPLLGAIDPARLDATVTAARARYDQLKQRDQQMRGTNGAVAAGRAVTGQPPPGQDGRFDPTTAAERVGEREQVMNQLDLMPPDDGQGQMAPMQEQDAVMQGPFELPPSPPLTEEERAQYSKVALERVLGGLDVFDREAKTKPTKKLISDGSEAKGFNRLAAGGTGVEGREGWVTLVIRVATRTSMTTEDEVDDTIKQEKDDRTLAKKDASTFDLGDKLREALWSYVLQDFRRRIDVAIAWLSEEWYSDRLTYTQRHPESGTKPAMSSGHLPRYRHWTLHALSSLITYLDVKDSRTLIRFLSEIPELDAECLDLVVKLAEDPERIQMATQSLLYLIMFRPPVREVAIDAAEKLWRGNVDARPAAAKVLGRWRPGVLEEAKTEGGVGKGEEIKAEV